MTEVRERDRRRDDLRREGKIGKSKREDKKERKDRGVYSSRSAVNHSVSSLLISSTHIELNRARDAP